MRFMKDKSKENKLVGCITQTEFKNQNLDQVYRLDNNLLEINTL